jgi:uncharacterized protein YjiS (DUF1127 family)
MINLAFTLIPSLIRSSDREAAPQPEESFLGKVALWARTRISYQRALSELHRLDDRDLDDIGVARGDFPALAWRHATGAEPLARPRG